MTHSFCADRKQHYADINRQILKFIFLSVIIQAASSAAYVTEDVLVPTCYRMFFLFFFFIKLSLYCIRPSREINSGMLWEDFTHSFRGCQSVKLIMKPASSCLKELPAFPKRAHLRVFFFFPLTRFSGLNCGCRKAFLSCREITHGELFFQTLRPKTVELLIESCSP